MVISDLRTSTGAIGVDAAYDYYPFGMKMMGRVSNIQTGEDNQTGYRYGFNGKEQDFSVKNIDGAIYDYGFRIYDSRVAKFVSVDPLTGSYPELTPYQYASNRPIDGIDLDGLEHVTYKVYLFESSGKTQYSVQRYDEKNPRNFGPSGPGALYIFHKVNNNNVAKEFQRTMKQRIAPVPWYAKALSDYDFADYGLYRGPTSLFKPLSNGTFDKEYDYLPNPIDAVDHGAYLHDKGYDRINAVGQNSLENDWATTVYDQAAVDSWSVVVKLGKGGTDPYNKTPITQNEYDAAKDGITYFNMVINDKKRDISKYMINNHYSISKNNLREFRNDTKKLNEYNYQQFLNLYMKKDDNGNWVRNESMWKRVINSNGENTFIPNAKK